MKKHYRKENDCLNCGTLLEGKFCHQCGQENLEIKESFGHMIVHAVSDYFHFDYQFFNTLKPLFFKPGFLTKEYMQGRRARYLHPVKMYIFISIVYFLLLFKSNTEIVKVNETHKQPAKTEKVVIDSVKKEIEDDDTIPDSVKKSLVQKTKIIGIEKIKANGWFHPQTADTSYEQYEANQKKLTKDKQDDFFTKSWNKKTLIYNAKYGSVAQEIFVEEIKHNIPKMMFLLLPLLALILKVAFWRNKKFYVEHLIYTFHLHCFLFLTLTILMLISIITSSGLNTINELIITFSTLYIIWYIYKSLKVIYERHWFRTITKLFGITVMYSVSIILCMAILFIASIAL